MPRAALILRIEGDVQGVGYRAWAAGEARRLGLAGWVRNRSDGSVELFAAGDAADLDALTAACRNGPASARVASVVTTPASDDGVCGFEQKATL